MGTPIAGASAWPLAKATMTAGAVVFALFFWSPALLMLLRLSLRSASCLHLSRQYSWKDGSFGGTGTGATGVTAGATEVSAAATGASEPTT